MNIKVEKYPVARYLDSLGFRTVRYGRELVYCLTDLTAAEQDIVLNNASRDELIEMCRILAADFRNVAEIEDLSNHPEVTSMKRFGFVIRIPRKRKRGKK